MGRRLIDHDADLDFYNDIYPYLILRGRGLGPGKARGGQYEGFQVPEVPALVGRHVTDPLPEAEGGIPGFQVGQGGPQAAEVQALGLRLGDEAFQQESLGMARTL